MLTQPPPTRYRGALCAFLVALTILVARTI